MKILFTHLSIKGKRAWGRVFPIARELVKKGHNVTIITSDTRKGILPIREVVEGIHLVLFPDILSKKILYKGFGIVSLIGRILFAFSNKFELVISDNALAPASGIPAFIQMYYHKTPYISEWWDFYGLGGHFDNKPWIIRKLVGRFYTKLEISLRKKATGVTVLTKQMFQRALDNGISENRLALVPGGSMVDILKPISIRGKKNNEIIFGFIGMGNSELEDIDPFLRALANHSFDHRCKLYYFGPEISAELIKDYGIDEKFIQHGWIDYFHDINLLQSVDVYILIKKENNISNYGWPNKLGDYLSLGKPVMVNPYGDVKEFINKFSKGFITTKWDVNSITNTINEILNNKYNLQLMGKYNRMIAVNECSWEERATRIINFYNKLKSLKKIV